MRISLRADPLPLPLMLCNQPRVLWHGWLYLRVATLCTLPERAFFAFHITHNLNECIRNRPTFTPSETTLMNSLQKKLYIFMVDASTCVAITSLILCDVKRPKTDKLPVGYRVFSSFLIRVFLLQLF